MAKAALIMDMPESCNGCDFKAYNVINKPVCILCTTSYVGHFLERKEYRLIDTTSGKPDWCPLRELPECATELTDADELGVEYVRGTMEGWNACLDEILK